MTNMEYLLKLIETIEEFDVANTETGKYLFSIRYRYSREGEIPYEPMQEVYRISDSFFLYLCIKQGILLKDVVRFQDED